MTSAFPSASSSSFTLHLGMQLRQNCKQASILVVGVGPNNQVRHDDDCLHATLARLQEINASPAPSAPPAPRSRKQKKKRNNKKKVATPSPTPSKPRNTRCAIWVEVLEYLSGLGGSKQQQQRESSATLAAATAGSFAAIFQTNLLDRFRCLYNSQLESTCMSLPISIRFNPEDPSRDVSLMLSSGIDDIQLRPLTLPGVCVAGWSLVLEGYVARRLSSEHDDLSGETSAVASLLPSAASLLTYEGVPVDEWRPCLSPILEPVCRHLRLVACTPDALFGRCGTLTRSLAPRPHPYSVSPPAPLSERAQGYSPEGLPRLETHCRVIGCPIPAESKVVDAFGQTPLRYCSFHASPSARLGEPVFVVGPSAARGVAALLPYRSAATLRFEECAECGWMLALPGAEDAPLCSFHQPGARERFLSACRFLTLPESWFVPELEAELRACRAQPCHQTLPRALSGTRTVAEVVQLTLPGLSSHLELLAIRRLAPPTLESDVELARLQRASVGSVHAAVPFIGLARRLEQRADDLGSLFPTLADHVIRRSLAEECMFSNESLAHEHERKHEQERLLGLHLLHLRLAGSPSCPLASDIVAEPSTLRLAPWPVSGIHVGLPSNGGSPGVGVGGVEEVVGLGEISPAMLSGATVLRSLGLSQMPWASPNSSCAASETNLPTGTPAADERATTVESRAWVRARVGGVHVWVPAAVFFPELSVALAESVVMPLATKAVAGAVREAAGEEILPPSLLLDPACAALPALVHWLRCHATGAILADFDARASKVQPVLEQMARCSVPAVRELLRCTHDGRGIPAIHGLEQLALHVTQLVDLYIGLVSTLENILAEVGGGERKDEEEEEERTVSDKSVRTFQSRMRVADSVAEASRVLLLSGRPDLLKAVRSLQLDQAGSSSDAAALLEEHARSGSEARNSERALLGAVAYANCPQVEPRHVATVLRAARADLRELSRLATLVGRTIMLEPSEESRHQLSASLRWAAHDAAGVVHSRTENLGELGELVASLLRQGPHRGDGPLFQAALDSLRASLDGQSFVQLALQAVGGTVDLDPRALNRPIAGLRVFLNRRRAFRNRGAVLEAKSTLDVLWGVVGRQLAESIYFSPTMLPSSGLVLSLAQRQQQLPPNLLPFSDVGAAAALSAPEAPPHGPLFALVKARPGNLDRVLPGGLELALVRYDPAATLGGSRLRKLSRRLKQRSLTTLLELGLDPRLYDEKSGWAGLLARAQVATRLGLCLGENDARFKRALVFAGSLGVVYDDSQPMHADHLRISSNLFADAGAGAGRDPVLLLRHSPGAFAPLHVLAEVYSRLSPELVVALTRGFGAPVPPSACFDPKPALLKCPAPGPTPNSRVALADLLRVWGLPTALPLVSTAAVHQCPPGMASTVLRAKLPSKLARAVAARPALTRLHRPAPEDCLQGLPYARLDSEASAVDFMRATMGRVDPVQDLGLDGRVHVFDRASGRVGTIAAGTLRARRVALEALESVLPGVGGGRGGRGKEQAGPRELTPNVFKSDLQRLALLETGCLLARPFFGHFLGFQRRRVLAQVQELRVDVGCKCAQGGEDCCPELGEEVVGREEEVGEEKEEFEYLRVPLSVVLNAKDSVCLAAVRAAIELEKHRRTQPKNVAETAGEKHAALHKMLNRTLSSSTYTQLLETTAKKSFTLAAFEAALEGGGYRTGDGAFAGTDERNQYYERLVIQLQRRRKRQAAREGGGGSF